MVIVVVGRLQERLLPKVWCYLNLAPLDDHASTLQRYCAEHVFAPQLAASSHSRPLCTVVSTRLTEYASVWPKPASI